MWIAHNARTVLQTIDRERCHRGRGVRAEASDGDGSAGAVRPAVAPGPPPSDAPPDSTRTPEHGHTPEEIRHRLARGPSVSYLRDWVYGGIDGAVTTFALVAGATGAALESRVILILGFANLVADGFSMAAANYSGTKAEEQEYRHLEAVENRHIDADPEGERNEVREIYRRKGFDGADLERVVRVLTGSRRRWIDTMLAEEYGLAGLPRSPLKAAAFTWLAFAVCGLMPLLPFLFAVPLAPHVSFAVTTLVFLLIGGLKSQWSSHSALVSAGETAGIGTIAAAVAFAIGALAEHLLGG